MRWSHVFHFIVEEGPVIQDGPIDYNDTSDCLNLGRTSGSGSGGSSGASVQSTSRLAGATAAESDQNIGAIGAVVGDYEPDRWARMCQEF